jgi:hypothetical protein
VFQQLRLAGSQGDIAAPHDADARKDVNRWHRVMIPDSVVNDQYVRAVHAGVTETFRVGDHRPCACEGGANASRNRGWRLRRG